MFWFFLFLSIALAGIAVAVMYAVWLWHKVSDLWSELKMLGARGEELTELMGKIEFERILS